MRHGSRSAGHVADVLSVRLARAAIDLDDVVTATEAAELREDDVWLLAAAVDHLRATLDRLEGLMFCLERFGMTNPPRIPLNGEVAA